MHEMPCDCLGLGQGRQEHPGQDGDDGDDHQELDQRKAAAAMAARRS
jgi:hypothetical protein